MKIVAELIASLLTVVLVSLVTLDVSTVVATVASFLGFAYLADRIVYHIKNKKMPEIIEWVVDCLILVANLLLIAGLKYHSITCLIMAGVCYVLSLVCNFFSVGFLKSK